MRMSSSMLVSKAPGMTCIEIRMSGQSRASEEVTDWEDFPRMLRAWNRLQEVATGDCPIKVE